MLVCVSCIYACNVHDCSLYPEQVLQDMTNVNTELSKARKKRVVSETLAQPDELSRRVLSQRPKLLGLYNTQCSSPSLCRKPCR